MADKKQRTTGENRFNFGLGVVLGTLISMPVAAWLSPRSGPERRAAWWRAVAGVFGQPLTQAQRQVQRLRGESVSDAIAEGRALAARQSGAENSARSDG